MTDWQANCLTAAEVAIWIFQDFKSRTMLLSFLQIDCINSNAIYRVVNFRNTHCYAAANEIYIIITANFTFILNTVVASYWKKFIFIRWTLMIWIDDLSINFRIILLFSRIILPISSVPFSHFVLFLSFLYFSLSTVGKLHTDQNI